MSIELELKTQKHWVDMQLLPVMDKVEEVALVYLDHAAYHPQDDNQHIKMEKSKRKKKKKVVEESEDESEESSDVESTDKSSSDEESSDDEEKELKGKKKKNKKKTSVKESSAKESTVPKADPVTQSNMDDLAKRFKRMELQLVERTTWESVAPRFKTPYCVMCGVEGHSIRDCDEAKFLIGQGICHWDMNNHIV